MAELESTVETSTVYLSRLRGKGGVRCYQEVRGEGGVVVRRYG